VTWLVSVLLYRLKGYDRLEPPLPPAATSEPGGVSV
jgi:hypothetical protein